MSKSKGSGSTTPTLPSWLQTFLQGNLGGAGGLPSLTDMFNNFPMLQTSGAQMGDIGNMFNTANSTAPGTYGFGSFQNGAITNAKNAYKQYLSGGPGDPSDATKAQIKEFGDLQAPGIQNWASSMGLGNSGASLDALAQGQEQAIVPFLEQDQANRLAAAQGLGGLGVSQGQLGAQEAQTMQNARGQQIGGEESIYQYLNPQAQNLFNKEMGQLNLSAGVRQQLLSLLGQLFGNKQSQTSTGFDLSSFV